MIVELAGLPGCGKSTVEGLLGAELTARGRTVESRDDLLRRLVRERFDPAYAPDHPRRRRITLRYRLHVWRRHLADRRAVGLGLRGLLGRTRMHVYMVSEDIVLARHFLETRGGPSDPRVLVTCEGLAHHVAAARALAGEMFGRLDRCWLDARGGSDLSVLHLELPVEEGFERLWRRGVPASWPRGMRSREGARATHARHGRFLAESLERFRSAGARVLSLDVSGPRDALDDRVRRIADLLDGSHRAAVR